MSTPSPADVLARPEDSPVVAALMSGEPPRILDAVREAILLVPAERAQDGSLVARTGTGPDGSPLLWAFTDPEALTAWDHEPAVAALAVAGSELARVTAPIALNPAGPGALVLAAGALGGPAGSGAGETERIGDGAQLPARSDRAPARREARERFDAGLAAAADGDLSAAVELLQEALDACGELGDRLHGADVARALARCHDARGDEGHARRLRERAAEVFDTLGEGELAAATRRSVRARRDDER